MIYIIACILLQQDLPPADLIMPSSTVQDTVLIPGFLIMPQAAISNVFPNIDVAEFLGMCPL